MARAVLRQIIGNEYTNEKVRKLIGKISNGFEYWFTLSSIQELNRLTTKLKGLFVNMFVQRKIIGTCAMKKGLRFMNGS